MSGVRHHIAVEGADDIARRHIQKAFGRWLDQLDLKVVSVADLVIPPFGVGVSDSADFGVEVGLRHFGSVGSV